MTDATFTTSTIGRSSAARSYTAPGLDADTLTACRLIYAIDTLAPDIFTAKYAPAGAGIDPDTILTATLLPHIRGIWNDASPLTGFEIGHADGVVAVDYADPGNLVSGGDLGAIFQASNLGIDRSTGRAAEASLARGFRRVGEAYSAYQRQLGIPADKVRSVLSIRAGNRLARVLTNEGLHNAIPRQRLASLGVLRRHSPTLRHRAASLLDTSRDTDLERDVLAQIPALIWFSNRFRLWAARKRRRDVLDALDLPRSIGNLKPGAAGTLWAIRALDQRLHDDDADRQLDLGWLSGRVCRDLPEATFRQRVLVQVAALAAMVSDNGCGEAVAAWLCKSLSDMKPGEIDRADMLHLVDYLIASEDDLGQANLRPWRSSQALRTVLRAADEWRGFLSTNPLTIKDGMEFERPSWAPATQRLPHSKWHLIRLSRPSDLAAAAGEFGNCAASYGPRSRRGQSALYLIRRLSNDRDLLHGKRRIEEGGSLTGSMVELVQGGDGQPILRQHLAPLNARPPATCVAALRALLSSPPAKGHDMARQSNGPTTTPEPPPQTPLSDIPLVFANPAADGGWGEIDLEGSPVELPPPGDYPGFISDVRINDSLSQIWVAVHFGLRGLEAQPANILFLTASRDRVKDQHRLAEGLREIRKLTAATRTPIETIKRADDLLTLIGKPLELTLVRKEKHGVAELIVRHIRPCAV